MSRIPPVPEWARRLVERACASEGASGLPVIEWGTARGSSRRVRLEGGLRTYVVDYAQLSHGETRQEPGQEAIKLWAGPDERDARVVLLHELAHWLTGDLHTPRFWDCAWRLYRRYMRNDLDYALAREAEYRVEAIKAAARAGVPGAQPMLERRRRRQGRSRVAAHTNP